MNKSTINEMNYYEQEDVQTIEKAVLAEALKFNRLEAVEGKFFIPSTTPSIDTEEMSSKKTSKYTESNFVELVIPPHLLLMFMKPQIVSLEDIVKQLNHDPNTCGNDCNELKHKMIGNKIKCILGFEQDTWVVPKGTEFLIEFLGGHMEIDHIALIGIYSLTTNL